MKDLAKRITQTPPKSFGMVGRAAAEDAKGRDLIHLELGRPVHDTPDFIKEATIDAMRAGKVHYGDLRGEPEFRAALVQKAFQLQSDCTCRTIRSW